VKVDLGESKKFINYQSKSFDIRPKNYDAGKYKIKITLTDKYTNPMSSYYTLEVEVITDTEFTPTT
jgi:hypothetical protein